MSCLRKGFQETGSVDNNETRRYPASKSSVKSGAGHELKIIKSTVDPLKVSCGHELVRLYKLLKDLLERAVHEKDPHKYCVRKTL